MLDANTRGIMQDKANAFLDIQNQYFKDQKSDADMTEYTTQPFWQSMYLSKKRLQEKGLINLQQKGGKTSYCKCHKSQG